MNWKTWLQGLAAAAISGAATAATQSLSQDGKVSTGTAAVGGIGALVGALMYLVKSPLTPAALPAAEENTSASAEEGK